MLQTARERSETDAGHSDLKSPRSVFTGRRAARSPRLLIGWVIGETWVEWTRMFCEWVESHRAKWGSPDQTVILLVDSAPTRGSLEALWILRQHNAMVIAFSPHLTQELPQWMWHGPYRMGSAIQSRVPRRIPSLEPASPDSFFLPAVTSDGANP
jgi:hypothetical protein